VSETPSVFGLNPNGKITGKYHLSIAYGNLCVISAIIGDPPVRHQQERRSPQVSLAGMEQCCHGVRRDRCRRVDRDDLISCRDSVTMSSALGARTFER
jgi:hypothetical protein